MRESIKGYVQAVAEQSAATGSLSSLAAELDALVDTLSDAEELKWALEDPAIPGPSRRAIIEELLTGKLESGSVMLVSYVVGEDRASEAMANLSWVSEELASEAANAAGQVLQDAMSDEQDMALGRSASRQRMNGYASALFAQISENGRLGEVEDELFRFARLVESSGPLRSTLVDWQVPVAIRTRIVSDLLAPKADPVTVRLAQYTLRVGRTRDLVGTLDWLVELAAFERNRRVGEVRVAIDLNEDETLRLGKVLKRVTGHEVELRTILDPEVIGGMSVRVGDLVIDGTLRRRLEMARRSMLPGSKRSI